MAGRARALVLVGAAAHLASLLLPFGSFKCFEPPPFFSLECALSGVEYVLLVLMWPSFRWALFAAMCVWLAAVLVVVAHAVSGRPRRGARLAALLLVPSFAAFVAAMPPHRWLGPTCAGMGAALVLWGALLMPRLVDEGRAQLAEP